MKRYIKTYFTCGLLLVGLLSACKEEDMILSACQVQYVGHEIFSIVITNEPFTAVYAGLHGGVYARVDSTGNDNRNINTRNRII